MKKAIYAGTFDPITTGHQFLIKEGSQIFDHLTVVLAVNKNKTTLFNIEERKEQIQFFIKDLKNVSLELVEKEYIANFAQTIGATYLLRGLRDCNDYTYEQKVESINLKINPNLKTIYISSPDELKAISSSMVKSLVGFQGYQFLLKDLINQKVLQDFNKKEGYSKIKKQWESLAGIDSLSKKYLDIIIEKHSEGHRFYHNITHLQELLSEADVLFQDGQFSSLHRAIILYSIFFHDIVYDPSKIDNEQQSLNIFLEYAQERKLVDVIIEGVSKSILASSNHNQKVDYEITAYFLDLDLSILGSSSQRYELYEQQIRQEFSFIPDEIYRTERSKIMQKLVSPYKTEWGKSRYQVQSQQNLKRYEQ